MYVTNISTLKALVSIPATTEDITVGGYYTENDGGGGSFVWKSGTRPTQDNGFVIYHSSDTSGWFQRLPDETMVNVRWFGAKGDGTTNDHPVFETVFALASTSSFIGVYVPVGVYYIDGTLDILNKTVHIKGDCGSEFADDNTISRLVFSTGNPGLKIRRDSGLVAIDSGGSLIEDIMIESEGHGAGGGEHGLYLTQRAFLRNITVKGFKDDGIHINGDIANNGTDTSLSYFEKCRSVLNDGNGFYIEGNDANQCVFSSCDAVDNAYWGFNDNSFLGNQFIACHCNNNNRLATGSGPYTVQNESARSVLVACYSENAAPMSGEVSTLSRNSLVLGGLHGTRVKGGNINIEDGALMMNSNGNVETFVLTSEAGSSTPEFNLSLYNPLLEEASEPQIEENQKIMRWVGPGAVLLSLNTPNYPRGMAFASTMFRQLFLNNKLVGHVTDITQIEDAPDSGRSYLKGDILFNSEYDGTNPFAWMCIKNGTYGIYDEPGVSFDSVDPGESSWLYLAGVSEFIREGYTLKIDNTVGTVMGKEIDTINNTTKLSMDASYSAVTNDPIYFEPPIFRALGNGTGETSQRPSLTAYDAGFQYYDTDLSQLKLWNGSSWV